MNELTPDQAVDIMARWSIWNAFDTWAVQGHESIPDIGEYDYDRVVERAEELLKNMPKGDVSWAEYEAALKVLMERETEGGTAMREPTNEEVVQLQHEFEALLSGEYPAATTEAEETADEVFLRGMREGFVLVFRGLCEQAFPPKAKGR